MRFFRIRTLAALLLAASLTSACSSLNLGSAAGLLSAITANPDLSTFASLLQGVGGLDKILPGGTGTLLAPTNDALAALGESTLNQLTDPSNKEQLLEVLKGHALGSQVDPDQLSAQGTVPTLGGSERAVTGSGKDLKVDGVPVKDAVKTPEGYLYVLDGVLGQ